jgi:DNA-binding MarR family transcriptional regulator
MPRLIGSKEAAAMLNMSRARVNQLAKAGVAPGLVRKEPGGYANRGRYLFDAEVIERLARERIAALESALDETRAAS